MLLRAACSPALALQSCSRRENVVQRSTPASKTIAEARVRYRSFVSRDRPNGHRAPSQRQCWVCRKDGYFRETFLQTFHGSFSAASPSSHTLLVYTTCQPLPSVAPAQKAHNTFHKHHSSLLSGTIDRISKLPCLSAMPNTFKEATEILPLLEEETVGRLRVWDLAATLCAGI